MALVKGTFCEPILIFARSALLPSYQTSVRLVQPRKAQSPMVVTLSRIVIEVREKQYSKAPPPMEVTLSGMVMEEIAEQPEKAYSPMVVTDPSLGITDVLHPATKVLLAVLMMQFPVL